MSLGDWLGFRYPYGGNFRSVHCEIVTQIFMVYFKGPSRNPLGPL
ncbi:hypothetical protein [Shigella phage ESh2]|nr:hypothetical protein [Shigella phage ESh2]